MKRLQNALLLIFVMFSSSFAQWSTTVVTGGAEHIGTAFDTVYVESEKLRLQLPDSTLSTNAHGEFLFVGDLNDPEIMWDKDEFHRLSNNTSWQKVDGFFPDRFIIVADTVGIDSIRIRDRDDMSVWMTFAGAGNSPTTLSYVAAAANTSSLEFLDGILYLGFGVAGENWGLLAIDFVGDTGTYTFTADQYRHHGGIATRNDEAGYYGLDNGLGIDRTTVTTVDAIRDVFGLPMPDGSGRLAQWWVVGTDDNSSLFNPHANAIYDNNQTTLTTCGMDLTSRGALANCYISTNDLIYIDRSIFPAVNDAGWGGNIISIVSTETGAMDTPWSSGVAVFSAVEFIERGSQYVNGDLLLHGSNVGLYVHSLRHGIGTDYRNAGKVLITDAGQSPFIPGRTVGAYHLETLANSTKFGSDTDLQKVGTTDPMAGNISMVFGSGYSSTDAGTHSYLWDVTSNYGGPMKSMGCWFKSASATNPASREGLIYMFNELGADDAWFYIEFDSSGFIFANSDDGPGTGDNVTSQNDLYDGKWHHVVAVERATTGMHLYIDGETAGIDGSVNSAPWSGADSLFVGARYTGGTGILGHFNGLIDHVFVSEQEVSAEEARAMYVDGIKAMESTGTTNDGLAAADVDYIHTKDGYVVVGDEDSLQVFIQGATTIIEDYRVASADGNIQDAWVWVEPGTDSSSYAYVTPTRLVIVQRDPNLLNAAVHRWTWEQPQAMQDGAVIVDSSGVEGVFTNIDDALGAAKNAGQGLVRLLAGSYRGFSADESYMTVEGSGHLSWVDGGTVSHGVNITGDQVTLRDFRVSTTSGGGSGYKPIVNNSAAIGRYGIIENLWISSSDGDCIEFSTGGYYSRITNNNIWNCDDAFIRLVANGVRFAGNQLQTSASYGIEIGSGQGDNSVITGNYISGSGNDAVFINTADEDVIVDGNRFDGWTNECIDDDSGTSTSGDNECS